MIGKNNWRLRKEKAKDSQKIVKYAIKKLTVGAASVAISAGWFFVPDAVAANEVAAVNQEASSPAQEAAADPTAEPSEAEVTLPSEPTVLPGAEVAPSAPATAAVQEPQSEQNTATVETVPTDKSALVGAIFAAQGADLTSKTPETAAILTSALTHATSIQADEAASAEEVAAATEALKAALAGLTDQVPEEDTPAVRGEFAAEQPPSEAPAETVADLPAATTLSPALQAAQESLTRAFESPVSDTVDTTSLAFENYTLAYNRALAAKTQLEEALLTGLSQTESNQLAAMVAQAAITLQRRKDQLNQTASALEGSGFRQTAQVNANRYIKFINMRTGQEIDPNTAFSQSNGQNIQIGIAVGFDENDTDKTVTVELGNFLRLVSNGSTADTVKAFIESSSGTTRQVQLTSTDGLIYRNQNNTIDKPTPIDSYTYRITNSAKQLVIPIAINGARLVGLEGFATDGEIDGKTLGIEKTIPIKVTTSVTHGSEGSVTTVNQLNELSTPTLGLSTGSNQGLWPWANHNANYTNQTIATSENDYTVVTSISLHSSHELSKYIDSTTVTYTLPKGVSFLGLYDAEQEAMFDAKATTDPNSGETTLVITSKYASYYDVNDPLPRVYAKLKLDITDPTISKNESVVLKHKYEATVRNGNTYTGSGQLTYYVIKTTEKDDILFFKQTEGVFKSEVNHLSNSTVNKEVYSQLGTIPYDIMAYTVDDHNSREKELHYQFPQNDTVQVRGIQLPFLEGMGTSISSIKIATKNDPTLREVALPSTYTAKSGAIFIAKEELGVADDDELTEVVVPIGVFKPGVRYRFANLNAGRQSQVFGIVKDESKTQKVTSAILTLRDRDYDANSSDRNWASTPGSMVLNIDPRISRNDLTITLPTSRTVPDSQSTTLTYKVESSQLPSWPHIQRTVDEVENLYLVLPSNVKVTDIRLKDQDGQNFTAEVTKTDETIQQNGTSYTVYKFDMTGVSGYQNILGFYGPSDGAFKERFFTVDVDIQNTAKSTRVVSLNQTMFADLAQVRAQVGQSSLKANRYQLDGNNPNLFTNRLDTANTITLTAVDKLEFSNSAKLDNQADSEYTDTQKTFKIDDIKQGLDMKFTITNPMDKDVGSLDYYIPIPKEGQTFGTNFQDQPFAYSLELLKELTLSEGLTDVFDVSYATVDSSKLTGHNYTTDELSRESFSTAAADYSKVNLIRIKSKPGVKIPAEKSYDIIANYGLGNVTTDHDGRTNSFRPFYLVAFDSNTSKNENADSVSVAITLGRLAIEVFEDEDFDGIEDSNETNLIPDIAYEVYDTGGVKVAEGTTVNGKQIIKGLVNNQQYTLRLLKDGGDTYRFTTGTIAPDRSSTTTDKETAVFTLDNDRAPLIKVGATKTKLVHQFDLGKHGTSTEATTVQAFYEDRIDAPTVKANEGYEFIGWREEGSNTIVSQADLEKEVYGPTGKTYVAEYLKKEQEVKVTLNWVKGTAPRPNQTVTIADGSSEVASLEFTDGETSKSQNGLDLATKYTVTADPVEDYVTTLVSSESQTALPADLVAFANGSSKNGEGVYTFTTLTTTHTVTNTYEEEKAALKAAAQTVRDRINARTDLTDEEKSAATSEVDQALNSALNAVDSAGSDADKTGAKSAGISAIESIAPAAVVKTVAKADIDRAIATKTTEINNRPDLTAEEKAAAIAEVNQAGDQAKAAIDQATSNDTVAQAKAAGIATIEVIDPTAAVKTAAKANVDQAIAAKTAEINNRADLTAEEKAAAIAEVNQAGDQAKAAIDQATTDAAVETAKTDGVSAIEAIDPAAAVKTAAKADIDQAIAAKTAELNNRPDLTAEEKAAAIAQVNQTGDQAKTAIAQAMTDNAVDQAKTAGIAAIEAIDPAAAVKTAAKAAVDQAIATKTAEINNRPDLTAEEKNAALAEVNQAGDQAKAAIDQATTDAAVDQAKTAGIEAIEAIDPTAAVKTAAKANIDQTIAAKTAEINNRPDLTAEEKSAAITEVNQAGDQAKTAIDQATTDNAVDQAKTAGIAAIEAIDPAAAVKTAAKAAVDQAIATKTAEINNRADLTAEEKTAAIAQVNQTGDQAKAAIDQAPTDAAVETAKTDGVSAIEAIDPTAAVKTAAKADVDQAVATKTAELNNRPDLTAEEKAAAIAEVNQAGDQAKAAIDQATTDNAVDQAKTEGISSIEAIDPAATVKTAAKADIDQAVAAKTAELNNRPDLTAEEKAAAITEVNQAGDQAKAAIDQATTDAAVETAKTDGVSAIEAIDPTAAVKTAAKAAVDQAIAAKTSELNNRPDLTSEEKAAAIAEVNQAGDQAKAAIDQATTDAAVDQAKTAGIAAIEAIDSAAAVKTAAKADIDQAIAAKTAEINNRPDLTAEEKAAAIAEVNQAGDQAKAAIDQATTDAAVDQAKTAGIEAIEAIDPTAAVKTAAKANIDQAIAAKTAEINNRPDLTTEEKAAAITEVNQAGDQAKAAIDQATTDAAVETAKTDGVSAIAAIDPTAAVKTAAKADVDQAVAAKTAELNNRPDLTAEEKAAAIAQVNQAGDQAKAAIDQATTDNAVDQAKTDGVSAIEAIDPTAAVKTAAKANIDQAIAAKTAELNNRPDLTTEEKAAAITEVNQAGDQAKAAIDQATTNAAVETAKTDGISAIEAIDPTAAVKTTAKADIDRAIATKTTEINNRPDLTAEEKAAAIAEVNQAGDQAKAAIDQATSNDTVAQAKTEGISTIEAIDPTAAVKTAAKADVDQAVAAKTAEINNRPDLTAEEKAAAIAEVNQAGDQAKAAIDQATTDATVETAKTDGVSAIEAIDPTAVVKAAAKADIDQAIAAKTAELNNRPDLTAEEKAAAIAQVNQTGDQAKAAIDQATTDAAVETAKTAGIATIEAIDPAAAVKTAAKADIDRAIAAKTAEINNRPDLTAEEKTAAIAQVNQTGDQAKTAIDQATTDNAVDQAKTDGVSAIEAIDPTAVVKTAAKAAVDQAIAAKTAEINNRPDLTAEEKAAAIAQVNQTGDQAKAAIDQATTDNAVDQAKTAGIAAIEAIDPTAVVKTAAKAAIDQAIAAKTAEINNRSDLTAEEKTAAIAQVNQAGDQAKAAIDQATTDNAVDQAKTAGIAAIEAIDPTAAVKTAAKAAIDQAIAAKTAEINNRPDLTAEEKTAAIAQVNQTGDQAKAAIDQATTDGAVETAKTDGVSAIAAIDPTAAVKTAAKSDVDQAIAAKTAEINNRPDLTSEEKAAAIAEVNQAGDQAKAAIDQATSNDTVAQAKAAGIAIIEAIDPTAAVKTAAKADIDQAIAAKTAELNNRPDLTAEEKAAALAQVNQAGDQAKAAIDQAVGDQAVENVRVDSVSSIEAIRPTATAKSAAKDSIRQAAAVKIADLTRRTDLSDTAKNQAVSQVQAAEAEALSAIDQANTNDTVQAAELTGLTNISAVTVQAQGISAQVSPVQVNVSTVNPEVQVNMPMVQSEAQDPSTGKSEKHLPSTGDRSQVNLAGYSALLLALMSLAAAKTKGREEE